LGNTKVTTNPSLAANRRPREQFRQAAAPSSFALVRLFGPGDESPFARKVETWITLDLILNYTFNLPPPAPAEVPGFAKDGGKNVKMKEGKEKNVVPVSTAEYGCSNWKWWLNNTTVTLGMQNVFDEDPPFVAGNFENGYDESLTTIKGRFWYVGLKKRF
jgi:outer membrane receptor protein involved in Fe transport